VKARFNRADGRVEDLELLGDVAPQFVRITPPAYLSILTHAALAQSSTIFRRVDTTRGGMPVYAEVTKTKEEPSWRRRKFSQKTT
jgi:hypothetical protein